MPQHEPDALLRRWVRQRVGVGIQPPREKHAIAPQTCVRELPRQLLGGPLAGVVAIISNQHPLDPETLEELEVLRGEAVHPVARRDMAVARTPEGQRIEQRLAEDHFLRTLEARGVPDAAMRAGQVEMQRRPLAQIISELPPVAPD